MPNTPRGIDKRIAWLAIAAFVVIWLVFVNQREKSQSSTTQATTIATAPKWDTDDGRIEAFVKSQTFMKRQLKTPDSADFPWITNSQVNVSHQGNGKFLVKAYVDAKNSYGAEIRTHYLCELQDKGNTWELISLNTN